MGAVNPTQDPGMNRKGSVQFWGLNSGPVLTDQIVSQVQVDILKTEHYNLRFSQTYKPIFDSSHYEMWGRQEPVCHPACLMPCKYSVGSWHP